MNNTATAKCSGHIGVEHSDRRPHHPLLPNLEWLKTQEKLHCPWKTATCTFNKQIKCISSIFAVISSRDDATRWSWQQWGQFRCPTSCLVCCVDHNGFMFLMRLFFSTSAIKDLFVALISPWVTVFHFLFISFIRDVTAVITKYYHLPGLYEANGRDQAINFSCLFSQDLASNINLGTDWGAIMFLGTLLWPFMVQCQCVDMTQTTFQEGCDKQKVCVSVYALSPIQVLLVTHRFQRLGARIFSEGIF